MTAIHGEMTTVLRITPEDRGTSVTLRVEGRLTNEWGPFLELHCHTLAQPSRRLTLDLMGVYYVDALGIGALKKLKAQGVELTGYSRIIQDLLDEEAA